MLVVLYTLVGHTSSCVADFAVKKNVVGMLLTCLRVHHSHKAHQTVVDLSVLRYRVLEEELDHHLS